MLPPAGVFPGYASWQGAPDAVKCFSDKVFYGTPATMVRLFEDFINVSCGAERFGLGARRGAVAL